MTTVPVPCPACGQHAWQPWRSPAGQPAWRYLRCDRCGLARLDPFPDPGRLRGAFDDGYFVGGAGRGGYVDYDADAVLHRANAVTRLASLPRGGFGPGLLVDVGCASGYTLDEAAARGWATVGVEVNARAAGRARQRGHRVEASLSGLADLAGQVDAVCFFQLLEHLADPVEALRQAAELLRPGGVLLCETWDGASRVARLSGGRWQQLSPPSVVWVFDQASMRAMVAAAGLTFGFWRRSSKVVSLGLVLGQLGMPRRLLDRPGPVGRGVSRVSRVRLRYGLGDLVLATARLPLA